MPDDTRTALQVGEVGILREEMLDGRVRLVTVGARPVHGSDVSLAVSRTSDFLSDRNERHGGLGRHHPRSEHERGFRPQGQAGTINIHLGALATSVAV